MSGVSRASVHEAGALHSVTTRLKRSSSLVHSHALTLSLSTRRSLGLLQRHVRKCVDISGQCPDAKHLGSLQFLCRPVWPGRPPAPRHRAPPQWAQMRRGRSQDCDRTVWNLLSHLLGENDCRFRIHASIHHPVSENIRSSIAFLAPNQRFAGTISTKKTSYCTSSTRRARA